MVYRRETSWQEAGRAKDDTSSSRAIKWLGACFIVGVCGSVYARALTGLILEPAWPRHFSGRGVGGRVPRGERGGPGVPPADRALGWSGTNHAAADRPPRAAGPTADVSIPGLVSRILTSRASWRSSGRSRYTARSRAPLYFPAAYISPLSPPLERELLFALAGRVGLLAR